MGVRGGRRDRRRFARRLARRPRPFRRAASRRGAVRRTRSAPPPPRIGRRSTRSTNWRSRSPARPSGGWRRPRRAAAFRVAARAAWDCEALARLSARDGEPLAYPVAVAAAAAGCGMALAPRGGGVRRRPIRQSRLRRDAAGDRRPDRRPEDPGRRSCRTFPRSRARRRARRSTISAPARCAPTSPRCGTKRNIRGCSAHDANAFAVARRRSAARSAPARRR